MINPPPQDNVTPWEHPACDNRTQRQHTPVTWHHDNTPCDNLTPWQHTCPVIAWHHPPSNTIPWPMTTPPPVITCHPTLTCHQPDMSLPTQMSTPLWLLTPQGCNPLDCLHPLTCLHPLKCTAMVAVPWLVAKSSCNVHKNVHLALTNAILLSFPNNRQTDQTLSLC